MKLYVGVSDNDWYRFLIKLPYVDEVNFWQPGGKQRFQTLAPGEPRKTKFEKLPDDRRREREKGSGVCVLRTQPFQ